MSKYLRAGKYLTECYRRLHWEPQRREAYVDKKLRELINFAYDNVQYYNKLFKDNGIKPSDIKSTKDLNKIPITYKNSLRTSGQDALSREYRADELTKLTTGGSTGEPFSIYLSSDEFQWRQAIHLRANIYCGQRIRDRWVSVIPSVSEDHLKSYRNKIGIFPLTEVPVMFNTTRKLEEVRRLNPNVLGGFSSSLYLISLEAQRTGVNTIKPRMVLTTGDIIAREPREFMEKVFNAPSYDQFGCMELDRTAWQCPVRDGYHLDADSVVFQFVDENGDEVASGERGEIIYTSLYNKAMPFIRYGIRDVGIPLEEECSCGNRLPMMKLIEGRANSFLVLGDGELMSPLSFIEALKAFDMVDEIEQYRVQQKRNKQIVIKVKTRTSNHTIEEKLRSTLMDNLRNGLPKILMNTKFEDIDIALEFVDEIPRLRSGKVNVISSEVRMPLNP